MSHNCKVFQAAQVVLVALILAVFAQSANAQSTRYWNRSVDAGDRMEFQWLNYDERSCKDYGYPKLVVTKKPKLGKLRTVRRKFTQRNGRCAGKRLSVLLVYYVAGRKKGEDQTAFSIKGNTNISINLKMRVK